MAIPGRESAAAAPRGRGAAGGCAAKLRSRVASAVRPAGTPASMSAVLPSQAAANRVAPIGAYLLALVLPPMFAFSITPSPTLLNQLLSVAGWGLCLALHRSVAPTGARGSPTVVLTAAFALLVAGVVSSWTVGSLPTSLALPPLGLLIAACALAALAARAAQSAGAEGIEVFLPFAV